jgi:putative transposase
MARLPRLVVPNQPHHVIQRGNDRRVVFSDVDDYTVFLEYLRDSAKIFNVAIHAYVLMPNHFHLLVTPFDAKGMGKMIQRIGRYYVPYFNKKYQRVGSLWQGRYKATVIDSEQYFMTCSRYIESNPVRANMVGNPADYPWSSYPHHIGVKADTLITEHSLYWSLGNTPFEREASYKELVDQALSDDAIATLSATTAKGWILGGDKFKAAMEQQIKRRVSPNKKGRPTKQKPDAANL